MESFNRSFLGPFSLPPFYLTSARAVISLYIRSLFLISLYYEISLRFGSQFFIPSQEWDTYPPFGCYCFFLRFLLLYFAFPLSDQLAFLFLDSLRSPAVNYSDIRACTHTLGGLVLLFWQSSYGISFFLLFLFSYSLFLFIRY